MVWDMTVCVSKSPVEAQGPMPLLQLPQPFAIPCIHAPRILLLCDFSQTGFEQALVSLDVISKVSIPCSGVVYVFQKMSRDVILLSLDVLKSSISNSTFRRLISYGAMVRDCLSALGEIMTAYGSHTCFRTGFQPIRHMGQRCLQHAPVHFLTEL